MSPALSLFFLFIQTVFLFCLLGLVLYGGYVLWSMRNELPYVPTPYSIIRRMIASAAIQATDRVIDLGSGTGRIIIEVAWQFPVSATGVERSSLLLFAARLRAACTRKKGRVEWVQGDLYEQALSGSTVVFCFLTTQVLARLRQRFTELPSGARVVSYKFDPALDATWKRQVVLFGRGDVVYIYKKEM